MTGKFDHFVFALIMTLITASIGGVLMVIAWAQILMEPPAPAGTKNLNSLYALTSCVCIGTVGAAISNVLPDQTQSVVWTLALMISFACIIAGVAFVRRYSGPARRAMLYGSLALFFADLIGFIGMFLSLPGYPLNRG
jgi:hypothetical protein